MSLFKPAWKGKDENKAIEKIKKINDNNVLYKIATDKTLSRERCMAAVKRITDQDILMKLALYETGVYETTYNCVSIVAMNLLEKSEDICKAARENNAFKELSYDAVRRITDPDVLSRIACLSTDPKIALYALRQLTDQKRISDAAEVGKTFEVNAEAVEMLTDRELLMQLAKKDGESKAHELALNKINDPADIADIAKTAKTEAVRLRAVKKLSDEDALADVARYSEHNDTRVLAIKKLSSRDILIDLANKCTDPEIIEAVLDKLGDSEAVKELAENGATLTVRRCAEIKLNGRFTRSFTRLPDEPLPWGRSDSLDRYMNNVLNSDKISSQCSCLDSINDEKIIAALLNEIMESDVDAYDRIRFYYDYAKYAASKHTAKKALEILADEKAETLKEAVLAPYNTIKIQSEAAFYLAEYELLNEEDDELNLALPKLAEGSDGMALLSHLAEIGHKAAYPILLSVNCGDSDKAQYLGNYPTAESVRVLKEFLKCEKTWSWKIYYACESLKKIYKSTSDTQLREQIKAIPKKTYSRHYDMDGCWGNHDDIPAGVIDWSSLRD